MARIDDYVLNESEEEEDDADREEAEEDEDAAEDEEEEDAADEGLRGRSRGSSESLGIRALRRRLGQRFGLRVLGQELVP
jgi:hypothetical protein